MEALELSQTELAKRSGVSRKRISSIIKPGAKKEPNLTLKKLKGLANALEVSLDELTAFVPETAKRKYTIKRHLDGIERLAKLAKKDMGME
jgi:transcriptional regulator with XRE-family HTH domain